MFRSQFSKHRQRRDQEKSMSMKVSSLAVNMARTLCAVALLSAALVWASVGGSIAGTVKDPSGRVVPNAQVSLRESNTGALLPDAQRQQGALHLPGSAGRPLRTAGAGHWFFRLSTYRRGARYQRGAHSRCFAAGRRRRSDGKRGGQHAARRDHQHATGPGDHRHGR